MPVFVVRLRPSVPSPVPSEAVTVQVVPLPVTFVIDGVPPRPLNGTSVKLPEATPLTLSENVTVHESEFAFVELAAARLTEEMVGAVRSKVYTCPTTGRVFVTTRSIP